MELGIVKISERSSLKFLKELHMLNDFFMR